MNKPKPIRLKVITDETAEGTRLVNADTGEPVLFEGAIVTVDLRVNQPPPPEKPEERAARLEIEARAIRERRELPPAAAKPHHPHGATVRVLAQSVPVEVSETVKTPFEWINHRLQ